MGRYISMVVKFNKGKIMDYNSDRPIESANQDLLGRLTFSKQLAEAIFKYGGKDGLVIGLFGKWGTGKTSILNIVVNEINSLSEDSCDKPIIVKFSPWNYTDVNVNIRMYNFDDVQCTVIPSVAYGFVTGMNLQLC